MVTGLEGGLAATQLISFAFQAFQGCLDTYQFCYNAQRIGTDGDLLRTRLQLERARLEEWGIRSRLKSSRANERLNWSLVQSILQQQQILLTSEEQLSKKYHLNVQSEVNVSSESGVNEKIDAATPSSTGLERIFAVLRPELYTKASRVISASNGPLKRVQWAASGRNKVMRVINDLRTLNDDLEGLLEREQRVKARLVTQYLLQDLLSRSTNIAEVDELTDDAAVAAAAEFKRIRLYMGADKRTDETQPPPSIKLRDSMPKPETLKKKYFVSSAMRGKLETGRFNNTPVLVEWRTTNETKFVRLEKNMLYLSALLVKAPPSFAALCCKGYIPVRDQFRLGLVYDIPLVQDVDQPSEYEQRNLHDLIQKQRKASLLDRVRIASVISDAVLQLHTAGWLHKSIRSENILFLAGSKSELETFLSTAPYLVGYEYARPDTNDAAVALTELPETPLYTDLYRHPDKRGAIGKSFQKRHDLYSLACLLVELALWEHLDKVFSRHGGKDWKAAIEEADTNNKNLELPSLAGLVAMPGFRQSVLHCVGPLYLGAIDECLREMPIADGSEDVSLQAQRAVVEKLRLCTV